jgi:hypothetical protein
MARRKNGLIPGYRKHRPSGHAVVSLSGQDFYLGPHGTKFSNGAYDRVVAEWLARGRRPLIDHDNAAGGEITLVELAARYKVLAKGYYRKNGIVTNEYTAIVNAPKVACGTYGRQPASAFGPLAVNVRSTCRANCGRTRRRNRRAKEKSRGPCPPVARHCYSAFTRSNVTSTCSLPGAVANSAGRSFPGGAKHSLRVFSPSS